MNNLLEKARAGRTSALASKAANLGTPRSDYDLNTQSKSQRQIDPIAFISKRAQNSGSAWLH
jgi:hypothetical protein